MGLALVQTQSLKLKMAPALFQSMTVLQCNNEELSRLLHEKALENPLLHIEDGRNFSSYSINGEAKSTSDVIEETAADRVDFRELLHQDLHHMRLDRIVIRAADILIDSLNDNGFIDEDPEAILDRVGQSDTDPEKALAAVQALEPAGVGARSLIECLCLQLRRSDQRCTLAETILTDYRDCFMTGNWSELTSLLGVTRAEIDTAVDRIRKLNPNPVAAIQDDPPQYIVPDVIISKKGGDLVCELEDQYLPTISVNMNDYTRYMEAADSETKRYLREKFDEADWLLSGVSRRRQTLMNLAQMVMKHQEKYFMTGDRNYLLPFTMKQAAERLSVHESTVSRAAAGKYVQTNYGVLPMKSFFVRAVRARHGTFSALQIQNEIKQLVKKEDRRKPLSDQTITQLLAKSGFQCSRRAVAKYRANCGIGSTIERRAAYN
ncbi:RNA polymerase factor sigma-54 [Sporolactobacillus shoreicorticis]|uniref:RNA polymerase factor sigma-54 n=1 Tax=Sporolactobacillus shoreicorticis TaxID=1923877 RepID=A0ABW5RZA4_9BACL|nr:RNA polymerase factor sigma-54 [Sporolactobacillus shoreicorticis]MCO7125053.1 RNA polymerase factor sigma-54 [Sporolactobacillus shoreicorticis]